MKTTPESRYIIATDGPLVHSIGPFHPLLSFSHTFYTFRVSFPNSGGQFSEVCFLKNALTINN